MVYYTDKITNLRFFHPVAILFLCETFPFRTANLKIKSNQIMTLKNSVNHHGIKNNLAIRTENNKLYIIIAFTSCN